MFSLFRVVVRCWPVALVLVLGLVLGSMFLRSPRPSALLPVGPRLPGGLFAFGYPNFPDDLAGTGTPEGFVTRFAGAKQNPLWFDEGAVAGHDIRTLNPQGRYFKHVNLRTLDSTERGPNGSKISGRPDYDWIHTHHPEWVIKDATGNPVPLELPTEEVLDFANDAYLDWVLNTWMPEQLFDRTDLAAPVIYLQHDNGDFKGHAINCAANDIFCTRYGTDEGMQAAWVHMLTRLRQRWPQVRIIISSGPNTYTDPDRQMAAFRRVLSVVDGYYSESLTDRHSYWKEAAPAEKRIALGTTMQLAAWLAANNKVFMPMEGQDDGIALTQDDTD